MSDDEEVLSDYEKLRLERVKRNQARLEALGLYKPYSQTFLKPVKRRVVKIKKRTVKHGQERRSARLRKKTEAGGSSTAVDEELVSLSSDSENFIDDEESESPSRSPRKLRFIDFEITQKELKALEKNIDANYLKKFREFLVYKNKISPQNERNVMRQVTKLAYGEGVRYESQKYGWPEGCYFMKGKKVTPMSDIVELLNEAQACEDKWGADRGNGWLLRHPLKKLLIFQQFCLTNPAFLKSLWFTDTTTTSAFQVDNSPRRVPRSFNGRPRTTSSQLQFSFSYTKGADIWPPTNEDALRLSDTFPNGQIPYSAVVMIEQQDMLATHQVVEESINGTLTETLMSSDQNTRRSKKKLAVPRSIQRILRRAAAKEEVNSEGEIVGLDRTPIAMALALLIKGLVRPLDLALVACFSTYLTMLGMVARSPRQNGKAPMLPAIPPQGHVPHLVSNPMGMSSFHSRIYDVWLKVGILVGLMGPAFYLLRSALSTDSASAMVAALPCGRATFLLCVQAISESVGRRFMAPLPLRILTPILYNTARLGFLWQWAVSAFSGSCKLNRSLAIANGIYWFANLFFFLLPVATIRYMRAHFFGVEALEVTMRSGMEESVGLVPNQVQPED